MTLCYVIVSCAILTWFRWHQEFQGRTYPFAGISCLYGVWMLANGTSIPLDGVTIAIMSLSLWMVASLLWSQKSYGVYEIFTWFSFFTLFTAAREIPLPLMAWVIVPNAAIFAGLQLYYQRSKEAMAVVPESRQFPIFGNSNHNAAFMLVGFYASLWIAMNGAPLMIAITLLIGIAIAMTRCRGALVALVLPLAAAGFFIDWELSLYMSALFIIVAAAGGYSLIGRYSSIAHRFEIYRDAIKQIHPHYLRGNGINYFRTGTSYGRVHNDHLEIFGELGSIGYALFLNIFYQMTFDPIIACAMASVFICGLFFFPLREVHTATPFWALMGSMVGTMGVSGASLIPLRVAGIFAVISVLTFVFAVFCNLIEQDGKKLKREAKG